MIATIACPSANHVPAINAIEVLNHRLTLVLSVIALVGAGLAFMDSRHASASDVQEVVNQLHESRIEDHEYKIEESERRIKRILQIPEADRDRWDLQDLQDAMDRKERYLRKLDRILGEE